MLRFGFFALALLVPLLAGCAGTEVPDPDELAGTLVDKDNAPAPGYLVKAVRIRKPAGSASGDDTAAYADSTVSDSLGRYAFKELPRGLYTIHVLDSEGRQVSNSLEILWDGGFLDGQILIIYGAGRIMGRVVDHKSRLPLQDVSCYAPGEDHSSTTDDSGMFTLEWVVLKAPRTVKVRCAASSHETAEMAGIEVVPGRDTSITFELRAKYEVEPRPPEPTGLKAVYDSVKGVVRLSWKRVFHSEPIEYSVKRFDPLNISASKVFTTPDTFYNDYVFPPEPDSSGPGKPIDLIYNVKTLLYKSNTLSLNHAYAEVKGVKPPPYSGPEVTLSVVNGKAEYAVGDTVRLAGGFRNSKRPNRRLFWSVDGIDGELMGRALSDSAGTDTLAYRLDSPGTTRIRFTVVDQAGLSASAWTPLPVVENP
jgi:hypothetical protein